MGLTFPRGRKQFGGFRLLKAELVKNSDIAKTVFARPRRWPRPPRSVHETPRTSALSDVTAGVTGETADDTDGLYGMRSVNAGNGLVLMNTIFVSSGTQKSITRTISSYCICRRISFAFSRHISFCTFLAFCPN